MSNSTTPKGLGNSSSSNVIYLDLVSSKVKGICHFRWSHKVNGKWETKATYNQLSGMLLDGPIRFFDREWEGEKNPYFAFKLLNDEDQAFIVTCRFSNLGIAILNNLLNVEAPSITALTFKAVASNKNGYPAVYVADGSGELIGFKYQFSDLPEVKRMEFGGKQLSDDTDRRKFIQVAVEQKYGVYSSESNKTATTATNTSTATTQTAPELSDDEPF